MNRTTDLHANSGSSAHADANTFMGSIRWIAVAIGLACLALLTMIAGVARAETVAAAPGTDAVRWSLPTAASAARAATVASSPDGRGRIERRKPSDR